MLSSGTGKCNEVVFAYQKCCSLPHFFYIERIVDIVVIQAQSGVVVSTVKDLVAVGFEAVRVAGMKVVRYFFGAYDLDVVWQTLIQCQTDLRRRDPGFSVKGCHVAPGMYAGVCPARTADCDGFL